MTQHHMGWKPDSDVYGEAAGLTFAGRVLDLVVTHCADGTFEWDVVDGVDLLASGIALTLPEAKRAAENAALRALCFP